MSKVKLFKPGASSLKAIVSGVLLIGGFLVAALANQYAVRNHLIGSTAQLWPDRNFQRMYFTREGMLVGARVSGTNLEVERFGRGANNTEKWTVDVGRSLSPADLQNDWVIDSEAQRFAYATQEGITVRPLCDPAASGCAGSIISLPAASQSLLAFSFVPGRMLAAVFNDGAVTFWDTETGNQIARRSIQLANPNQARFEADYLAVVSGRSPTAKLFRIVSGTDLKLVEESKTPATPYALITPGTGQIGYLRAGAVFYRGTTRNSPGTVHAAVLGASELLVGAGDFDGLSVLAAKEDPYALLESEESKPRADVLASNGLRLAYSGPGGTGLVGLTTERRVTATGRRYNFLGFGLALIGGLLAASSLLFDIVGMSFKAKGTGKKSRKSLLEPGPSLVNGFLDGTAVLWAGAGLSAHAGFPTRQAFLHQTLQTADGETWIEPKLLATMYERVQKGQAEDVLDTIIETLHYQRHVMIQYFKAVFCRYTPLSPCHKVLRRLPFAAAITTNYDGCLEMAGPLWANNVVTLRQGAHRGAAEKDQFFLLRLYGDPRVPADVKLSHKEFAAAVKADPTIGDTLETLFRKKTMFFVGCSPEGLVADLKLMPGIKGVSRKHYAVAGVGGSRWAQAVETLEKEYGIDCVICDEETIGAELPKFLSNLADQIEQAKADKSKRGSDMVELAVKKTAAGV